MNNSLRLIAAAALIGCATGAYATSFVYTTDLSVRATGATSDGTSDLSNSFKDDKIVLEARDDAATFVASQGQMASKAMWRRRESAGGRWARRASRRATPWSSRQSGA